MTADEWLFILGVCVGFAIGMAAGAFIWTHHTLVEVERRRKLAAAAKRMGQQQP